MTDYRREYLALHGGGMDSRPLILERGTVTADCPRAMQPTGVRMPLKPHQLADLHRMREIESESRTMSNGDRVVSRIGFLADKVGSGKTITMLARIASQVNVCNESQEQCFGRQNLVFQFHTPKFEYIPVNVIVVPHTLVKQWVDSLAWTTLTYHVVSKASHLRDLVEEYASVDVLLVSHSFYKNVQTQFCGYTVDRVVFDEADTINIPRCPAFTARFTWMISASVNNLLYPQGRYHEDRLSGHRVYIDGVTRQGYIRESLESLRTFPFLSALYVRCADAFVDASFQLPHPIERVVVCQTPSYMRVVHGMIPRSAMESLNAGDTQSAVQILRSAGVHVEDGESIVSALTLSLETRLQNLRTMREATSRLRLSEEDMAHRLRRHDDDIQNVQGRIDEITAMIRSVQEGDEAGGHECPICMDTYHAPVAALTCCQHVYCYRCIIRCVRCPMCKVAITSDLLAVVDPSGEAGTSSSMAVDGPPTKLDALIQIVRDKPNGKFLVFSNYDRNFGDLIAAFQRAGVPNVRQICSNGATVNKTLESFRTGSTNVLLLKSSHFGSGLDLQVTSDVVFFHSMGSEMQMQVIGRAQRPGRSGALCVTYLKHSGED
jgi:hypothetical protein